MQSERPRIRKRNRPAPALPETIRVNEVKPPHHDGTPRYYGRKWTLSASVNHVSGCCQDFVVVMVVTDSSSSRVMR